MRRPDDSEPPGVDFVLSPVESGADEDLPQPEDVGASVRSRVRVAGVVLAVLVVLGALFARGVATHRSHPVADPSTEVSTPASIDTFEAPVPIAVGPQPPHDPGECPRLDGGQSVCSTRHNVRPSVLAAVRSHFPGARVTRIADERLRDIGFGTGGIWYRSIEATQGSTRITVVIRVARASDLAIRSTEPNGSSTTLAVQDLTPAFAIKVSVTASSAHLPGFRSLDALAADKRLVG